MLPQESTKCANRLFPTAPVAEAEIPLPANLLAPLTLTWKVCLCCAVEPLPPRLVLLTPLTNVVESFGVLTARSLISLLLLKPFTKNEFCCSACLIVTGKQAFRLSYQL